MRRKKETRRKTQNPRQALFCRKERHNKTWRILTTVIRFILKEWRMISVNENSFNLNKNIFQISWNLIFIDIQLNQKKLIRLLNLRNNLRMKIIIV